MDLISLSFVKPILQATSPLGQRQRQPQQAPQQQPPAFRQQESNQLSQDAWIAKSVANYERVKETALTVLDSDKVKTALGAEHEKVKGYYLELIEQAQGESGEVQLGTMALQRAYVALNKLIISAARDKFERLGVRPVEEGYHDESSPILGIKADSFLRFREFAQQNPALLKFAHALYFNEPSLPNSQPEPPPPHRDRTRFEMIPMNLYQAAEEMAQTMLRTYLDPYDLKPQQVVEYYQGIGNAYTIVVRSIEKSGAMDDSDWKVKLIVPKQGANFKDFYQPSAVMALHELAHVERHLAGHSESPAYISKAEQVVYEMPPTILGIMLRDEIFDQVAPNQDSESPKYPTSLPGEKAPIPLEKIAQTFRVLVREHGSIEDALMSDAGMEFVMEYFTNSKD